MKKFFTLYFILTFCVAAFGQTAVVSGIVTDEKDKSAMIGVNIRLKGTSEGTITDVDGNYTLEIPADKIFSLEFTYTGYQTRTVDFVGLKHDERKTQNVLMSETSKDLDIVVVTGSRVEKSLGQQTVSMEVLRGQNITQSNQTLNEAMNKVPGV
ncbi:MAG TPA: carboxypeptidase-like regulatory domain-containing protein, partial [Chitinophagales bacterium]